MGLGAMAGLFLMAAGAWALDQAACEKYAGTLDVAPAAEWQTCKKNSDCIGLSVRCPNDTIINKDWRDAMMEKADCINAHTEWVCGKAATNVPVPRCINQQCRFEIR